MSIHDARVAVGGVVGAGARQQQQRFDGFIYSAAALRNGMKKSDTAITL
jgi:hypothetical protein